MDFSSDVFAAKFGFLKDSVEAVGAPLCGPDQFVHVSLHFNSSSNAAATDGPRAICWAHISENEYIDKNPDWNRRRSDTRCLYSCTITFWSDGTRFECCEETRDAYRQVAARWLKTYIRNQAGDPDARVADDLEDIQRVGDTGNFGIGHSFHHNDDDDFGVIEGCDGRHENHYSEFEPDEDEENIYEERIPHFRERYLPRGY